MIEYRVPNFNQCGGCHTNAHGKITPIGPRPRHLAKEGQLEHLVQAGVITHVPDVIPTPDYRDNNLPLERRVRSYLEANCAHCHAQGLPADTSGLYLNLEEDRPLHLGVHKKIPWQQVVDPVGYWWISIRADLKNPFFIFG